MQAVIEFLKVLSDPTRLKMIKLLQTSELAVCEIAFVMGVSQPTVSQHLRKLDRLGLIKERREGLIRYCTADESVLQQLLMQVQALLSAEAITLPAMQDPISRLMEVKQLDPLQMCKSSNCRKR